MKKSIQNYIAVSILSAFGAFGVGYLLLYFLQTEIVDFAQFVNGIMAMTILCVALTGATIYFFIGAINLIILNIKGIPVTQTH